MQGAIIVVTVFAGSILILAIIGSTILMGLKIIKGGVRTKDKKSETDEARVIQEMYQGLGRMEERVESLETIILDRERERKDRER
jgi:phage shock protein B